MLVALTLSVFLTSTCASGPGASMETKPAAATLRAFVGPYQALVARQVGETRVQDDEGVAFWEPVEKVLDGLDDEEVQVLIGWQYPSRGGKLRVLLTFDSGAGKVVVNGKAIEATSGSRPIEILVAPSGSLPDYTVRVEQGGVGRTLVLRPCRLAYESPELIPPAGGKALEPEAVLDPSETEALTRLIDSVLMEIGAGRQEKAWQLMDETFRKSVPLSEFTKSTAAVAPTLRAMREEVRAQEGGSYLSKRWMFGLTRRIRSAAGDVRVIAAVGWANGRFNLLDLSVSPL